MIDVLMITIDDNANTGWRTMKCLQRMGLKVLFLKGSMHPYYYPEQGLIHPKLAQVSVVEKGRVSDPVLHVPQLKMVSDSARCIHYIASRIIDTGTDPRTKKIVMQHGGRFYRTNHGIINELMDPYIDASIIQMPDLMGLGAKNEHLIYFSVDTDFIQPSYETGYDKLIIGHFPSLSTEKGTDKIIRIIQRLGEDAETKGKFLYDGVEKANQGVQTIWFHQLQRMSACDVIVDVCAETAQNRPYGEWGNTAFEAAALGKVVITNSHRVDMYEREYGCKPSMRIANTEEEVEKHLRELIALQKGKLFKEKQSAREWVVKKHSIEATSRRMWDKVYSKFKW
jgi:glycosyltransferase involved in cell wall biosynthesis